MATYYVDGAVGSDSNAGTSAGAGNAWATIAHALATMVGADLVYVKASATYSIGTGLTASAGTLNQVTRIIGYYATPGDYGLNGAIDARPVIQATAAITGLTISASGMVTFENFILDGNNTGTIGISLGGNYYNGAVNCWVKRWTSDGVVLTGGNHKLLRSEVSGCGGRGTVFLSVVQECKVHGNTGVGIASNTNSVVIGNTVYGNGSHGIDAVYYSIVIGNTCHGNTGSGITTTTFYLIGSITNNILTSNGAYGISCPNLSPGATDPAVDYNWFGTGSLANTSGARNIVLAGPHDASGDPQYVNAAVGDFTPQNALVRAASNNGWIGAVQPTPSSGSTYVINQTINRYVNSEE